MAPDDAEVFLSNTDADLTKHSCIRLTQALRGKKLREKSCPVYQSDARAQKHQSEMSESIEIESYPP